MGPQLIGFVNDFFRAEKFVKSLNKTYIALLPKTENPTTVDSLRSICKFWWKGKQEGDRYLALKSWKSIIYQLKGSGKEVQGVQHGHAF